MVDDEDRPDTENVVALFRDTEPPPLTVNRSRIDQGCKHGTANLDETVRMCVCNDCGAQIEPFDWLVEHCGKGWTRHWENHVHVRKETIRLQREQVDLKREVKNLKAQVKRWRQNARNAEAEAGDAPELAQVALKSESDVSG